MDDRKYKIVAVMDEQTCRVCAEMDGNIITSTENAHRVLGNLAAVHEGEPCRCVFVEVTTMQDIGCEHDKPEIITSLNRTHTEVCDKLLSKLLAKAALFDEMAAMLERYRKETPLGNQPHMIAGKADLLIAKAREIE